MLCKEVDKLKKYEYDSTRYFWGVTAPGIFMIMLLIYGIKENINNPTFGIPSLIIITTLYGINNTFIALSHPKTIVIDKEGIEFHSFGRVHSYSWARLDYFMVKEFSARKLYLRIENPKLFKGRYWIKTNMYNDSDELYLKINKEEKRIHPNLLKFKAKKRRPNKKKRRKK